MSDLNQCNFIGRLGADPESRNMPNGDQVCNIRIAVGEQWKDNNGQKQERTEWVSVSAFRGLAGIMSQYLTKGSKVFVSGKMKTRKWQDSNGQDRYSTEIVANEMQMLDSKGGSNNGQTAQPSGNQGQSSTPSAAPNNDFVDDIPFN